MSWVEEAIAAYGRSLGMEELALDQDLRLELALDSGETIRVESLPGREEVLVGCARSLPSAAGAALRRALQLSDFRQNTPWPLQAALEGDGLVLQLRIAERSFTVNELDNAIAHLLDLQQVVRQAGQAQPAKLPVFPLGWR